MIIVKLLGPARKDPELQCLVAQICARLDESEVKGKQTARQASMSNTQTLRHVNVSEHRG